MLRLIVHADDFGLSERVNEGILQAHLGGIVTSASIMANGNAFEHAAQICRDVPSLDVGIHLTLVEERPILEANAVPSLVDASGRLHDRAATFTKKYLSGKIRLQDVRAELEAQIRKVLRHKINASHLDSHQHLHMFPQILDTTIRLARKYRIPAVRLPRETIRLYMFNGHRTVRRMLQLLTLNIFCRLGKKTISQRTDHFAGFFLSGNLHKQNLQKLLQSLPPNGTCELMCHPGLDDSNTPYSHWGYHWSNELTALADPEITDFLRKKGIRLISYRQLARAPQF
jgi:hopanoid biosynthesis associated protein HpnK